MQRHVKLTWDTLYDNVKKQKMTGYYGEFLLFKINEKSIELKKIQINKNGVYFNKKENNWPYFRDYFFI
jgi:hypothetical protein